MVKLLVESKQPVRFAAGADRRNGNPELKIVEE
jgi:hypothetical protein